MSESIRVRNALWDAAIDMLIVKWEREHGNKHMPCIKVKDKNSDMPEKYHGVRRRKPIQEQSKGSHINVSSLFALPVM